MTLYCNPWRDPHNHHGSFRSSQELTITRGRLPIRTYPQMRFGTLTTTTTLSCVAATPSSNFAALKPLSESALGWFLFPRCVTWELFQFTPVRLLNPYAPMLVRTKWYLLKRWVSHSSDICVWSSHLPTPALLCLFRKLITFLLSPVIAKATTMCT